MAKLTSKDAIRLEVPDDLNDSLIVRCLETPTFGESKGKKQPMITAKWEIVGVPTEDGIVDHIMKNGEKFIIAGLPTRPTYHVLSKKALFFYKEFWGKAHGYTQEQTEELFEVDDENPDVSFFNGLVMSAKCVAEVQDRRKKLTEDERRALIEAGEPNPQGEIMINPETGEPEKFKSVTIDGWNRKYTGELPTF